MTARQTKQPTPRSEARYSRGMAELTSLLGDVRNNVSTLTSAATLFIDHMREFMDSLSANSQLGKKLAAKMEKTGETSPPAPANAPAARSAGTFEEKVAYYILATARPNIRFNVSRLLGSQRTHARHAAGIEACLRELSRTPQFGLKLQQEGQDFVLLDRGELDVERYRKPRLRRQDWPAIRERIDGYF